MNNIEISDIKPNDEGASPERERKEGFDGDRRKDLFRTLSMAMNMMKLSQSNKDSGKDFKSSHEIKEVESNKTLFREKLEEKLGELLCEQQALVELYMKAAKAAKDKEKEYKEKIAELVEQTEKDRQLMDLFRSL